MKIRIILTLFLFVGVSSSCKKEEVLSIQETQIAIPSNLEEGDPPPPPPPPIDDDDGNPFEIG